MKFIQPINSEEREFCRHIADLLSIGSKSGMPKFSGFLTEREQQLAQAESDIAKIECSFWGGHEEAARRMFCSRVVKPDDFPLEAVTFFYRLPNGSSEADRLSHRDFLGALMSLGIKRDQIGDIAVSEEGTVVFASQNVMPLIRDEISKVGRIGVRNESGIKIAMPRQKFNEMPLTVASLRLDAIVSGVCGLSRDKAASLIKSGGTAVNGIETANSSANLEEGDVFSVKGYGKFVFSDLGSLTKKGKTHITIKKYI